MELPLRACLTANYVTQVLTVFQSCSDKEGRLQTDKFCRLLEWPSDRNRVVGRMVACFDGDADQTMDFREVRLIVDSAH